MAALAFHLAACSGSQSHCLAALFWADQAVEADAWSVTVPDTIHPMAKSRWFSRLLGPWRVPFIGGRTFNLGPECTKAWLLLLAVSYAIFLINKYAVEINGLNGAFMDAITTKNAVAFKEVLVSFARVLVIYMVLGPMYTWIKELIILEWTKSTTRNMLRLYKKDRNYYRCSLMRYPDNPNERIQQDVPAVCRATLAFSFIVVDSIVTFILFGHILWSVERGLDYTIPIDGYNLSVTHLLLWILVIYAVFGTNGVYKVGKRLIDLQAEQRRLSADFRVGMVLFEKYAEPIAAYRGEEREYNHLWARFMLALKNNYVIVGWQRNLGFFTTGYSKVAGLLPYAVLAPFFFAGQIAFGSISRAADAFFQILASASIFVSQFDALTALLASLNRVCELKETLEDYDRQELDGSPRIRHEEGDLLTIEHLTLFTPDRAKVLVTDLNLRMVVGKSVLIKGPSGSGKTSILRSVVGLPFWDRGSGVIKMPSKLGETLMLSQLAYLMTGASLREQMQYPTASGVSDDELVKVLKLVNLPHLMDDVGGLDGIPNWDQLSGGERQRLVVARVLVNKVRLVIADEATSGLDIENEKLMYREMQNAGVTMLSVGHRPSLAEFHDYVIELLGDGKGGWRLVPTAQATW
jgi:putative ATP-binding cassette transporter